MMQCRPAHVDEIEYAAQLRSEMAIEMGGNFDALCPEWQGRFCRYFAKRQSRGDAQVFLAFDGDNAVGCALVSVLEDYRRYVLSTPSAVVNGVFVKRAYRRRGIARELMRQAMGWARERGCARMRLRSSEEGRALYESIGFRPGREMECDLPRP